MTTSTTKGHRMIAQLNDITISGATLTYATWYIIGLAHGVLIACVAHEVSRGKKLRKV